MLNCYIFYSSLSYLLIMENIFVVNFELRLISVLGSQPSQFLDDLRNELFLPIK